MNQNTWPDIGADLNDLLASYSSPRVSIRPKDRYEYIELNRTALELLNPGTSVEIKIDPAAKTIEFSKPGQYVVTEARTDTYQRIRCRDARFMPGGVYIAIPGKPNCYRWATPIKGGRKTLKTIARDKHEV